jgi:hypothetical protein
MIGFDKQVLLFVKIQILFFSLQPKFFFGNSDLFDAEEDSESNAKNSGKILYYI